MLTKAELRTRLRQNIRLLSEAEVEAKSARIVGHLKSLVNWNKLQTIHCFEPVAGLREVKLSVLIDYLRVTYPGLSLYVSRQINGTWQETPLSHPETPVAQVYGCVIVPMLGFDPVSLQRLGRGGGYYDRLLAGQPQALKVGVCFESGKVNNLPAEPHDVSLNVILTEEAVYQPYHLRPSR